MLKVKILQTTMVAGKRYAKGDAIKANEAIARDLDEMGKGKVMPENQAGSSKSIKSRNYTKNK